MNKSSCLLYPSSFQLMYHHCMQGNPPSLSVTVPVEPEYGNTKTGGKDTLHWITWPICHSPGGFHWSWWRRPPYCAWTRSRLSSAPVECTHSGCPPEGEKGQSVTGKITHCFIFLLLCCISYMEMSLAKITLFHFLLMCCISYYYFVFCYCVALHETVMGKDHTVSFLVNALCQLHETFLWTWKRKTCRVSSTAVFVFHLTWFCRATRWVYSTTLWLYYYENNNKGYFWCYISDEAKTFVKKIPGIGLGNDNENKACMHLYSYKHIVQQSLQIIQQQIHAQ